MQLAHKVQPGLARQGSPLQASLWQGAALAELQCLVTVPDCRHRASVSPGLPCTTAAGSCGRHAPCLLFLLYAVHGL